MQKIFDFKAFSSKGKEIDFSQFQGKVLLIVNTASKCGLTSSRSKTRKATNRLRSSAR